MEEGTAWYLAPAVPRPAILLLIVFILPVVYCLWTFLDWARRAREIGQVVDNFPGASKHWLFGTSTKELNGRDSALALFREYAKQWPRACRTWLGPFRASVLVYHPDTVKKVVRSTLPKQVDEWSAYYLIKPWLGDGLLLSSGAKWFRNRRLLTPEFHFDVLKPYMAIYNEASDIFLDKLGEGSRNGQSVELFKPVSLCTLNIILRCAFSFDDDVQRQGSSHPYVNAILEISKLLRTLGRNPLLRMNSMYLLIPNYWRYKAQLKIIHDTSRNIIQKRTEALKVDPECANKRYKDFLDILLLARDEESHGLSNVEIKDEVDTFLFEGHDTIASAISWILYELANHPEHQKKCRHEINELLADRESPYLNWDDLQRLPYLSMCIKEAIRVHSPVPVVGRQVDTPFELEGVTLRPGTAVALFIYLLHHNEAVWGADHMEYKPERFDPDGIKDMDPYAFLPFSAGSRNCIGQNFAMHELKVVVARTLQRFYLSVDAAHPVEHMMALVMRSVGGIHVFLKSVNQ